LTAKGTRQMWDAAEGLFQLGVDIDEVISSPLTRAQQTAEILAETFGCQEVVQCGLLRPDSAPSATTTWLRRTPSASALMVVGHEPQLSYLIAHLTSGSTKPYTLLSKGSAALISFDGAAAEGRGELEWLLTRGMLRRISLTHRKQSL